MSELNTQIATEITQKLREASENTARIYNESLAAGAKSEYDLFWDTFQNNGNRRYYEKAFADTVNQGRMWKYGLTYRPKYPMKPLNAMNMFEYGYLPYKAIAAIDFSECTNFYLAFSYFAISSAGAKFPPIDISRATRTDNMFSFATGIKEIEKITVSETTPYTGMFYGTSNLVEVRFEGTIGKSGLDFKSCKSLSKESIENVIEHLSYSTRGLKVTFSKEAVDKAFEEYEGANNGSDSVHWTDNVLSWNPYWTIALA